ncbi:HAMP domain-containing histidine kinase [Candidatus Fermentibacterales bacterium]|nr:HAMP domain-containing histidine kinase [Candidatus Fermentibacterales bacterium]
MVVALLVLAERSRRVAASWRSRARELRSSLDDLSSQIESLDSFRTELLVRIGAEIRAPLSSIRSRAQLLAQPFLTTEEIHSATEAMRGDLDRLDHYLDSLGEILELHSMELESGRPPLLERGASLALDEVLMEAIHALGGQVSARGLSLAVASDRDVAVRADREYLTRALVELLSDAIGHAARGEVLHVRVVASASSSRARLEIGYTGEPHSDASSSALPVALARQIVSAHGGMLSSGEGPGHYSIELLTDSAAGKQGC